MNQRWQYVRENTAAVRVQGDVSANREEVVANSDRRDVVGRSREQFEAIDRRDVHVRGEHKRALRRYHEYVSRCKADRHSLSVDGQPARALHDRRQLDLLRWWEPEGPRPSSPQDSNPDAASARQ